MDKTEGKKTLSKWFAHTAKWFVLFAESGQERKVAERLQGKLDLAATEYVVFCPTRDYSYAKKGRKIVTRVPLFTRYVFIATTASAKDGLTTVKPLVYYDESIYKLLSNDGTNDSIELNEHDKLRMTAVLDENFNIPAIEAFYEGDNVVIVGGVLDSLGGKVVKVDKHKKVAMIEFEFLGRPNIIKVALDMIVKPD